MNTANATYAIRVVESVDQCSGLEAEWNALLAHSNRPTVFNTFAWAWCWLQIYWQHDYALKIILVESSNHGLVALLPLYVQQSTGSCWFIGSGEPEDEEVASEYLDFIVHHDHVDSAELSNIINAQLETLSRYRLVLVNCCASSYVAKMLRDHKRALFTVTGTVYKLTIQSSFDETAKAFSKRLLKNARQYLARFNAAPDVDYVPLHSDSFEQDWQSLQTLHQKDWISRGKHGAFYSEKFSRFHALMHAQQPQIKQVFAALQQNGEALAIHHFYVFDKHYCFYLAGTEKTKESRLSPGLLLHVLTMQELNGQQITYDFMKGKTGNSYKAKICGAGEAFYTITIFERSMRGVLHHGLAGIKRYIKTLRKPVISAESTNEE